MKKNFWGVTLLIGFSARLAMGATPTLAQLLNQVAPTRNSQAILSRVDQLSSQVKKIPFPAGNPALKDLNGYAYESLKNADFNKAYQGLLTQAPPAAQKSELWPWVHHQFPDMTSTPNEYYSTLSGNLVRLYACEPHDCPNSVTLSYDPQNKNIWGLMHIEEFSGNAASKKTLLLGNPSDEQLAQLLFLVKDRLTDFDF